MPTVTSILPRTTPTSRKSHHSYVLGECGSSSEVPDVVDVSTMLYILLTMNDTVIQICHCQNSRFVFPTVPGGKPLGGDFLHS